ncbi:MAG: Phosphoglycolate phosphatase [Candidatus Scalindua rubra]|uniref:phosphoglycolate phosphatase n=1 Tax=Candidatus Scalindua rubra TaxID=1872076 RepID=A0A1E3X9K6_9BACT|nr:MAG: Phosphoglycolate phosphatase [Candidatus Scalindua rubra]
MASNRLILFDIDGTLVTKHKSAKGDKYTIKEKIINKALNEFYQSKDIDFTKSISDGLTDWIISERAVRKIFNQKTISKSDWANICQLVSKDFSKFNERAIGTIYYKVLPGVLDLLQYLCSIGAEIGIMTGNIKCFAKYKLNETGLLPFFTIGGYGENGKYRVEILQHLLTKIKNKTVYLVGDTVNDGLAAEESGIYFIGVGTTGLKKKQLSDSLKSDEVYWVRNLTSDSIYKWILKGYET